MQISLLVRGYLYHSMSKSRFFWAYFIWFFDVLLMVLFSSFDSTWIKGFPFQIYHVALWIVTSSLWIVDCGLWIVDCGLSLPAQLCHFQLLALNLQVVEFVWCRSLWTVKVNRHLFQMNMTFWTPGLHCIPFSGGPLFHWTVSFTNGWFDSKQGED
jgi:hypothetical protein